DDAAAPDSPALDPLPAVQPAPQEEAAGPDQHVEAQSKPGGPSRGAAVDPEGTPKIIEDSRSLPPALLAPEPTDPVPVALSSAGIDDREPTRTSVGYETTRESDDALADDQSDDVPLTFEVPHPPPRARFPAKRLGVQEAPSRGGERNRGPSQT